MTTNGICTAGRVAGVDRATRRATVIVERGCERCRAGRGCGAGLLVTDRREMHIEAAFDVAPEVGDQVGIAVPHGRVIQAAARVYGLPLVFALAGSALGSFGGDGGTAIGVLTGLFTGMAVAAVGGRSRNSPLPRVIPAS
jgi:positive regulator of sigma E activity